MTKNNISKIGNRINLIPRLIVMGIVCISTVLTTQITYSQFVRNGSFENHKDTTYPYGLSPSVIDGEPG